MLKNYINGENPIKNLNKYYKSGQGKEYMEPTADVVLFDEEGYPNYKIEYYEKVFSAFNFRIECMYK